MANEPGRVDEAKQNTDREIWRGKSRAEFGDPDCFYADSLFVPQGDVEALGINCGGIVIVMPIRKWHALAAQEHLMKLISVEPQPTYIESSGRWHWPLPERAHFKGCCTSVVTASREWWEYAPAEAKPHPNAAALQYNEKWYWVLSNAALAARSSSETGAQADVAILDSYHVGFNAGIEKAARYVEKSVYSRINGSLPKAIRELREDRQS